MKKYMLIHKPHFSVPYELICQGDLLGTFKTRDFAINRIKELTERERTTTIEYLDEDGNVIQ